MKNEEKKKELVVNWKFVAGFFATVFVVSFLAGAWSGERDRVNDELERINWNAGKAIHMTQADLLYHEAHVSDDGKWFLVPEVNIKFPYFWAESIHVNDIGYESRYWSAGPLRYAPNAWWDEYEDSSSFWVDFAFEVFSYLGYEKYLEFELKSGSQGGMLMDDLESASCINPFRISSVGWIGMHDEEYYEVIAKLQLVDGRAIELRQKSKSSGCSEFLSGNVGKTMAAKLKEMQSY